MIEDLKCKFVNLMIIYSKRLLYGYNCNIDGLWEELMKLSRIIKLHEHIESCNLRGNILDEINKELKSINKIYGELCKNC